MEGKQGKGIRIPEHIPEKLKTLLMKKDRLVILLLGGILLLVIALPVSKKDETESGTRNSYIDSHGTESGNGGTAEAYAAYLEEKLADTLSRVEGVGQVQVMVTLKSSAEKVVEKDVESESESVQETDSQGGSRSTINSTSSQTTVYSGDGSGQSGEPYITKELTPAVEGVIVIAEGGNNAVAVQNITEAVQALFEIDTHKIKVMKSN
ncbi:MAG: stage III sporulation protein AG [Eubacteriales bacterium]|nr:stage III sporulation protein AG [Eubacteriales bacterium]